MSVIRIKKARVKPYVILDTTALNDARLSFRAKGIHTYLMSRPDDWQVHIEQLEKQSPREARDAIRAAMQELECCGYIKRVRIRGPKGRMMGWDTTVYETPLLAKLDTEDEKLTGDAIGLDDSDQPKTDYPTSVEPTSDSPTPDQPTSDRPTSVQPKSDNPQLLINDSTQYGKVPNIDSTTPPSPSKMGKRTSKIYEDHPVFCELFAIAVVRPNGDKGDKGKALERWRQIKPSPEADTDLAERILRTYAFQKTTRQWQEDGGQYVPEIQVWLGRKPWESVQIPQGFDRYAPTRATPQAEKVYKVGDILPDGSKKGAI